VSVDLAGRWRFALDPEDRGLAEGWWDRSLPDELVLPGSLQAQGHGEPVSAGTRWTGRVADPELLEALRRQGFLMPFWLVPERTWVGPAWYQREVEVPDGPPGRRWVLSLERPHGETRVWWDDRPLGAQDSLATPHAYEVGAGVPAGRHRITLRVDNRLPVGVGEDAHSVSDHTQTNWNGVVGALELRATPPVWLEDVQVYPDAARRRARVVVRARALPGVRTTARVTVGVPGREPVAEELVVDGDPAAEVAPTVDLGPHAPLWDEFAPALCTLRVRLEAEVAGWGRAVDARAVSFGVRTVARAGTRFAVNGREVFLRGTLDCAAFPLTGFPPTDRGTWMRILGTVKAYGLNHVRFHSWCPPRAAFEAADRLGLYLQVECGVWTRLGDGAPVDTWLYAETDRILRAYGNHPSFAFLAHGNEPSGPRHREFLAAWVRHVRAQDDRRLVTAGSGWPSLPESDYHVLPDPRIQHWGEGLASRLNARPPETESDYREVVAVHPVPVVAHEAGQWCAFPDPQAAGKYTGHLRPEILEVVREGLAAHGLGELARAFHLASGRLQLACYKEEVEAALRTPGLAGLQLLGLQDFPGQGTAPVGVVDALWDPKDYAPPAAFRRFAGPTVVLVRLPRRVLTTRERLAVRWEVAHFGPRPLRTRLWWRLEDAAGMPLREGGGPDVEVAVGGPTPLGAMDLDAAGLPAPSRVRLVAGLEGTDAENDWDLWVFPPAEAVEAAPPPGVVCTDRWSEARAALAAGGRVVFLAPPEAVRSDVALGFTPVFWNTAWTRGQPPHTLGLWVDADHPALAGFPTDEHADWQWWEPLAGARAMVLDGLPPEVEAMVRPIDTWFRNRRLALVFEARVGPGRLLAVSLALRHDLARRPAARQLRASLLRYAAGAWEPRATVSTEELDGLWA
jgi:hypothetical protein